MNSIYASYCGISLAVQSEMELDRVKIREVVEHYLPGIIIESAKRSDVTKGEVIITFAPCFSDEEEGVWNVKSANVVEAQVKAKKAYPYLILGVWTNAIDFILQNRDTYFFHSTCALVNGKAVLFWGPRADGKSTLAKTMRARGHVVLHDDRVGVTTAVDDSTNSTVPMVCSEQVELLLTPKIIPAGELRMWPVNPHSLRYELFCELSKNVRGVGTIEGNLVFQSLDQKEVSLKRLQFCDALAKRLYEKAYFIEGTPEEICDFVETTLTN